MTVDGNDVEAVHEAVTTAVDQARAGDGPTLVEALTYRWKGHSKSDKNLYRTREGSMVRGLIDDADDFARDNAVPLGVLAGARLTRDVPVDHLITHDDVELDESSLIVKLRRLQEQTVQGSADLDELKSLLS